MIDTSPESRFNERIYWLVCCALVMGMLTCAAFTLLSFISRLLPEWQPRYLAGLVLLVSFERFFTYRRFGKLLLFSKEWALALLAEWVVILLVVRTIIGLTHGTEAFLEEVRQALNDFSGSFLSNEFLFALALLIATWFICGSFAGLIEEMGLRQSLILQELPESREAVQPARERLLNHIVSLGTFLIVLTALVRVDLRVVSGEAKGALFTQVPGLAGGGASTLLYFMLGLALLSQTQFIDLHTQWSLLRLPVSSQIARGWAIYGLIFFGALAAAVAILPTSYSLGFLALLGNAIGLVTGILFLIGQAILTILFFLLSLPFMLLGREPPLKNLPPAANPTPPPAVPQAVIPQPAWLEMAKTLAFWLVLAAILIYSISQYLRQHTEVLQALLNLPGGRLATRLWSWLRSRFAGFKMGVIKMAAAGRERIRVSTEAGNDHPDLAFLNLRRLDPRQRVRFFYLALVRRGAESGLARQQSQTPNEYAAKLDSALPGVKTEIDSLTEAFIEARYSPQPVAPAQAGQVKNYWERIRKALRGKADQN
jgi:hypothetical protein